LDTVPKLSLQPGRTYLGSLLALGICHWVLPIWWKMVGRRGGSAGGCWRIPHLHACSDEGGALKARNVDNERQARSRLLFGDTIPSGGVKWTGRCYLTCHAWGCWFSPTKTAFPQTRRE